jgi:hypothetical protein
VDLMQHLVIDSDHVDIEVIAQAGTRHGDVSAVPRPILVPLELWYLIRSWPDPRVE